MKTTRRQALQLIGAAAPSLWAVPGPAQVKPAKSPPDNAALPLRMLAPDEAVFFNSDHSPIGAFATLLYGAEASGGVMMQTGGHRMKPMIAREGILVAVKDGHGKAQVMPFCPSIADPSLAEFADRTKARRVLRACVDAWDTGLGVSWKHYTPYWQVPEIEKATPAEMARFLLPATWMTFRIDNSHGAEPRSMLFSLLDPSPASQCTIGDHHGFILSKRAVTVDGGITTTVDSRHAIILPQAIGKLLDAEEVQRRYGVAEATTPIEVEVAPGATTEFTVIVSHFNDQPLAQPGNGKLYLTKYYASVEAVALAAIKSSGAAKGRALAYRAEIRSWGLNTYREFLYGHALASYMFNTRLDLMASGEFIWTVIEGEYNFINTLDLTVDQAFLELAMHPWTVRNELDLFANRYRYTDRVEKLKDRATNYEGGISFNHDMGIAFEYKSDEAAAHPSPLMSQEELQNWILCAGLYWAKTRDTGWLKGKASILSQCLASMLVRDDVDPASRDGVSTFTSVPFAPRGTETTTYDSLDASLSRPTNGIYTATKSFASYLALEAMFKRLGDKDGAASSRKGAALVARTVAGRFDPAAQSFPARFGGESDARVIPAIEGLVYPHVMGLKGALSPTGPYGEFIRLMKAHMNSVLKAGICLDATTGAWKMSSSTVNTWESKIYLAQFVTEEILGIKDVRTNGRVDAVHYGIQVLGNHTTAWTDQINSDSGSCHNGSRHYPRGVTAYLWSGKA